MGKILIGIDGGGTYTRVAVADTEGNLLAHVENAGASNLSKDANARENVQAAIREALGIAGRALSDVAALAAGVAGLDEADDLPWARELTLMDGLNCPMSHENDAVAAHAGAFLSEPGIIAISGTGSIVFGITEDGRRLRNYDFQHYASAARFLTIETAHKVIAGETDGTDRALVEKLLAHLDAKDIPALARLCAEGFAADRRARIRLLSAFAPEVTGAAEGGSRLAQKVCGRAAEALATGIKLLGACFDSNRVRAALIGGVARSAYMKNAVARGLRNQAKKVYELADPALPSVLGAVVLAMGIAGITVNGGVIANLTEGAAAISRLET